MNSIQDIWNTPQIDWRVGNAITEVDRVASSVNSVPVIPSMPLNPVNRVPIHPMNPVHPVHPVHPMSTHIPAHIPTHSIPHAQHTTNIPTDYREYRDYRGDYRGDYREYTNENVNANTSTSTKEWKPQPQSSWKQNWKPMNPNDQWRDWKVKDTRLRKTQSATVMKEKRIIPNRFVARQLKPYIREPEHPIGLFLWGFGDHVKVKDIIHSFSEFGEFMNIGISTKNGIRYCFIDFDNPSDTLLAYQKIPEKVYFGMPGPLQVRYRYEKTQVPCFDQEEVNVVDVKTVHIQNLPHNINKVLFIN
jgi:hypothetical protein